MRRHPSHAGDWMSVSPNSLYNDAQGWLDASDHPIARFDELLKGIKCGSIEFPLEDREIFFDKELLMFAAALSRRANQQGCR